MTGYLAIIAALILFHFANREYKVIALILAGNFIMHKLCYLLGIKITTYLENQNIYACYAIIEAVTIKLLISQKSQFAILAIILSQICYNMLTTAQYLFAMPDFYSSYFFVMGVFMALELVYMGLITDYGIRLCQLHSPSNFSGLLFFRRWGDNRGVS